MSKSKPENSGLGGGLNPGFGFVQTRVANPNHAVTKTPKFPHITPILESPHWLNINERIKYKVLSLTYKSLKTGQPSYLRSLLSFTTSFYSVFSYHPRHPSLTSRLELQTDLSIILLLVCGTVSHLILITPSPTLKSPVCDLSTSLFLTKLTIKTHLPLCIVCFYLYPI